MIVTDSPPQIMTIERFKELRTNDVLEKLWRLDWSVEAAIKAYPDVKVERIKAQEGTQ